MKTPRLLVVIPTHSFFEYAASAVLSAFTKTWAEPHVLVVDDASPNWDNPVTGFSPHLGGLQYDFGGPDKLAIQRFTANGGLTRSWNQGLRDARDRHFDYACVTNSDVLFTNGWDVPLTAALDRGYSLVGPVTNAPGTEDGQNVRHYRAFDLDDDPKYLDAIAHDLGYAHGNEIVESTLNGFCLMAKTKTWWANAYDDHDVFRPRNDTNSRGEPNPTPLMTLQEYELQRRWHAAGLKTGFCPGSLVVHYRSVSRGDRYKKPGWFRKRGAC